MAATAKAEITPLHVAAYNGHVSVIRVLLADGSNVNARNENRWTPLHEAAYEGHSAAIEIPIFCRANVDARNEGMETPLHAAAIEGPFWRPEGTAGRWSERQCKG